MPGEHYVFGLHFVPLVSSVKIFGFSEYLAGLALMALVWTIADSRYKFRIDVAPWSPRSITYSVVATVGVLTLLTDLWRASKWPVPDGHLLSPALWQGILGGLFLLTFLTWSWMAFFRPWSFGRLNARRFNFALRRIVLPGSPTDLAIIADELCRSADGIVRYATEQRVKHRYRDKNDDQRKPPTVERCANDIFMLIADKRFCMAVANSAPQFAWAIFSAVQSSKRYHVPIRIFASNLLTAALANKNSFVYHEMQEGYRSGFFGYAKPITHAMFSNYELVDAAEFMLDVEFVARQKWDRDQWEAYCRIVSIAMTAFIARDFDGDAAPLYRALSDIGQASNGLPLLNGVAYNETTSEATWRLRAVTQFVLRAIKDLDSRSLPPGLTEVIERGARYTIFDALAELIFKLISDAACVRSPIAECMSVQYNWLWGDLFQFENFHGAAGRVVQAKLHHLIREEILRLRSYPNFHGAVILGFCLNVIGIRAWTAQYPDPAVAALHQMILCWTKRNFVWLYAEKPRVAESCLVDGTTYDADRKWIIRTTNTPFDHKPKVTYLILDTD